MKDILKLTVMGLGIIYLSSCATLDEPVNTGYTMYTYNSTRLHPQAYILDTNYTGYTGQRPTTQPVVVPDSWHVNASQSPVSFKDRDKNWVTSQKPQNYTIEIADDEKASQVAQKLLETPKNDRMAQIKYQQNGKAAYKGVYGSYDSAEAAKKALDALPTEIRQSAGIKNWSSVQGNLDE